MGPAWRGQRGASCRKAASGGRLRRAGGRPRAGAQVTGSALDDWRFTDVRRRSTPQPALDKHSMPAETVDHGDHLAGVHASAAISSTACVHRPAACGQARAVVGERRAVELGHRPARLADDRLERQVVPQRRRSGRPSPGPRRGPRACGPRSRPGCARASSARPARGRARSGRTRVMLRRPGDVTTASSSGVSRTAIGSPFMRAPAPSAAS